MFNDKYLHSIDPKGRLSIARDLRTSYGIEKGDLLYLFPNVSDVPYLEIRTARQWAEYESAVMRQTSSAEKRNFMRLLDLSQETVKVDSQGRIVIPQRIREACSLGNKVGVINMTRYLEVWDQKNIEQSSNSWLKSFRDINDKLF